MRVAVTGASGFVAGALLRHLRKSGCQVRGVSRGHCADTSVAADWRQLSPESGHESWVKALDGVDVLVHCAARVHQMDDRPGQALADYRRVNRDFTLELARASLEAGVKRFVFLSTVKVNGEEQLAGSPPYRADDIPAPVDDYGRSKLEAELGLSELLAGREMEWVVVRPVLVYGPGVGGNFAHMLGVLMKPWPLPLAAIDNRRSLLALDNLVDFVGLCTYHPDAVNRVWMISDDTPISTGALLSRLNTYLPGRACLFRAPSGLLRTGAQLLGKGSQASRLFGSLVVDSSPARDELGWRAPVSMDEALKATAEAFRSRC